HERCPGRDLRQDRHRPRHRPLAPSSRREPAAARSAGRMNNYIDSTYCSSISYMPAAPVALPRIPQIGPGFRSRDAIAAGVSWRDLYALRDYGAIIELSRGLYQLADASGIANVDFVAVCGRAPDGMICLNSALAYWDLSDEIPVQVHLAVSS